MNELLQIKKGLLANLPEEKQVGAIYITTDEKAAYVDVSDSERIRLSDIVFSNNFDDAPKDKLCFSTKDDIGKLYYYKEQTDEEGNDTSAWTPINETDVLKTRIANLEKELTDFGKNVEATYATKEELQQYSDNAAETYATKEALQQHSDNAAETYATKEALEEHIKEIEGTLVAADAMTFKGVLGGEGNLTALPAAEDTLAGDTYKIGANGTYAGFDCYVGDLIVAKEDGKAEYYHVSSGYEDDFDPYLTADAENNKITLKNSIKADLGSISFEVEEGSSLSIATTATTNEAGVSQTKVTLGYAESDQRLYWGSF